MKWRQKNGDRKNSTCSFQKISATCPYLTSFITLFITITSSLAAHFGSRFLIFYTLPKPPQGSSINCEQSKFTIFFPPFPSSTNIDKFPNTHTFSLPPSTDFDNFQNQRSQDHDINILPVVFGRNNIFFFPTEKDLI